MQHRGKEEELDICVKGCHLIRITETWWVSSRSWSPVMIDALHVYRLFRKSKLGRVGREICLVELYLEMREEAVWDSSIRITAETNIVSTWFQPLDQEKVDVAFFQQNKEASCLQVLVLMGYFNHLSSC